MWPILARFSPAWHWFFAENFTIERWRVSDVRIAKNGGSPTSFWREHVWKNTWVNLSKSGFVSEEGHSGCKYQNIAISALKGDFLCHIWFKWTYQANLVNWWGSSKNNFAFSDHSFTRLAAARWQDSMTRGQKSWNFLYFLPWFSVHFWTMWR